MINHIGSSMLTLKKSQDTILTTSNYLNYLKQNNNKLTVKRFQYNKEMISNNKSYNQSNNKDHLGFQYRKKRRN
jgi:hypothetical protein